MSDDRKLSDNIFLEAIINRVNSPFVGSLILSSLLYHWRIILVLIFGVNGESGAEGRISEIYKLFDKSNKICWGLEAFGVAFAFTYFLPYLNSIFVTPYQLKIEEAKNRQIVDKDDVHRAYITEGMKLEKFIPDLADSVNIVQNNIEAIVAKLTKLSNKIQSDPNLKGKDYSSLVTECLTAITNITDQNKLVLGLFKDPNHRGSSDNLKKLLNVKFINRIKRMASNKSFKHKRLPNGDQKLKNDA